jgi:hypothetical protein
MSRDLAQSADDHVLGFLKLGQSQHIEDLVHGKMYMNPLAYFVKLEGDAIRHDAREGQAFWMQPDKVVLSIKLDGKYMPIPGIRGPIAQSNPGDLAQNVFCMYALRSSCRAVERVDPRNSSFGDTFAAFTNGDEFLRRVQAAAQKNGHHVEWSPVEYVDKASYSGPIGIFKKASEYSYQSEFRTALRPGTGSPYILDICDLADITITGILADLNRLLYGE